MTEVTRARRDSSRTMLLVCKQALNEIIIIKRIALFHPTKMEDCKHAMIVMSIITLVSVTLSVIAQEKFLVNF